MPETPILRRYSTGFTTTAEARHPWPDNCFIQGGDGIVLAKGGMEAAFTDPAKAQEAIAAGLGLVNPAGSYRTCFFEAFPRSPDTFLRGEGASLAEAEDACWRKWQAVLACPGHDYERRNYRSGAGICRHCGMFCSSAFATTLDPCVVCGEDRARSSGGPDRHGRWRCKRCFPAIPEDDKSYIHKQMDSMKITMKDDMPPRK